MKRALRRPLWALLLMACITGALMTLMDATLGDGDVSSTTLREARGHDAYAEEAPASDLPEVLDGIDGEAIKAMVVELASDDMRGRKTGFEGGRLVENWVVERMGNYGLHPADAGGAYLEPFRFPAANTKAPIHVALGGRPLRYGDDYYDLIYGGGGSVEAPIVFVGYGIHRPDLGWNDYAAVDVKGKVVMAIRGAPPGLGPRFQNERYIGYKSSTAADQGAVGFILVQSDKASTGTIQGRFHRGRLPAIWCSGAQADRVLGTVGTTLGEQVKRVKPSPGLVTKVVAAMKISAEFDPNAVGNNALGMIKGRDPDLRKEVILIGAHMDHLGVDPTGRVFNGADDNASGTAVMMHLADILTKNRWRPKRSILFVGFGAEEQGLYGSKALAERLPFAHSGIACVLNMDMVGQGKAKVIIGGGGPYPRMQAFLEQAVPASLTSKVEVRGGRSGAWSDHWPFHDRGIAAFSVGTEGPHPNYHTHLDDSAAIQPALLELTAQAMGALLVALGEHAKPLLDADTPARYLVRSAPRILRQRLETLEGDLPAFEPGLTLLEVDGRTVDSAEAMKRLRAAGPQLRMVESKAGLLAALAGRKPAVLPLLELPSRVRTEPGLIAAALDQGYRWLAPFQHAPSDQFGAAELAAALAQLRALGPSMMLVDRAGLDPAHAARLEGLRLTDRPIAGQSRADWMVRRQQAGATTLLVPTIPNPSMALAAAFPDDDRLAPIVLSGMDEERLVKAVTALRLGGHVEATPGHPGRARLSTVLGEALVAWFPEGGAK